MTIARYPIPVRILAISGFLLLSCAVTAGDWKITPRFNIEETYTDNVRLSDINREGDFITTVSPGVSVRGESVRVNSNIDYNRQERFYFDQTQFDGGSNQLQADVATILLKDWLFFDTSSRMSQQSIDSRRNFGQVDRGNNSNLNDVTSYELTPRIKHTFGSLGTMDLNYERQSIERGQANDTVPRVPTLFDSAAGSSDRDSFEVDLRSGSVTGRLPVGINASSRNIEYADGRVDKFKRVSADLSYVWNSEFRFTGRGGYDDNQFRSARGLNNGATWSIGGTWTPSPRSRVMVDWGDRFFGKALKVDADHRHRRWRFNFAYNKDVRTSSDFERDLLLIPLFDESGQPIFDPVGNGQIFVPIDSPGATSDVFIEKSISGEVSYSLRRSNVRLALSQSKRQSQSTLNNERNRSVTFNVDRQLSPRLRTNLGVQWRDNKSSGATSTGSYYSIFPAIDYDLNRYTTARLRYEYTVNDHGGLGGLGFNSEQDTYFENAITASLIFHL